MKRKLRKIYRLLEDHFGDLKWWPARSSFEVIVGAVLTQNTAWTNVEKAIKNLKKNDLLKPDKIRRVQPARLSKLIRSSGYHRIKAQRLKEVSRFLIKECGGRIAALKNRESAILREKLLAVKGIGPETADSILVYALGKPVFVVDAYTKRIFSRHGIIDEGAAYEDIRSLVTDNFSGSLKEFNQFHALLVETAKKFCRKKAPLCDMCPLSGI